MMIWVKILSVIALTLWVNVATANSEAGCSGRSPEVTIGNGIMVRDAPMQLKAVSYTTPRLPGTNQPNLQLVREDFAAIRRTGFNAIRTYEPLQPAVLDAVEDAGLLVVQALAHLSDETNFDYDEELHEVIEQAQEIVLRDSCRSSIVMWSIWNDAPFNWGSSGGNVVERFGAPTVHRFLKKLRDAVKDLDKTRPITAANVLNSKYAEIGMDLLDVIGVNVYFGVFDWPSQRYSEELANKTAIRVRKISEKYRSPVWIAETGISSIPGAHPPDVVIPAQIRLIERVGFAGFSIFQWRDDPTKASDASQASVDVEANWGLINVRSAPKFDFTPISLALKGTAEDIEQVSFVTREPWQTFDEIPLSAPNIVSKLQTFEDFKFHDSKTLRAAYRLQSKGNSRVHYGLPRENGRWLDGLSLRYVPEDYGAWMILGRKLSKPIPFERQGNLVLDIHEHIGGRVNLVIIFRLTDGRTMRTPPILLQNNMPRSYQLKLSDLIVSSASTGAGEEIAEVRIRLNDVANYEEIGVPVQLVIKSLRFFSTQHITSIN